MQGPHYGVAISGISQPEHVTALNATILEAPDSTEITLGISTCSVLDESMELWGRPELFVPFDDVSPLLLPIKGVEYLAHVTLSTSTQLTYGEQVKLLYEHAGLHLGGVQINSPSKVQVTDIHAISRSFPTKHLVFPLGRTTMRKVIMGDLLTHNRLKDYLYEGVTTLLLDNSSGSREPLAIEEIESCIYVVEQWSGHHLRIAGRLGPTGTEVPARIKHRYPELSFSWEVESLLRDPDDQFNTDKARKYLQQSFRVIRSSRQGEKKWRVI